MWRTTLGVPPTLPPSPLRQEFVNRGSEAEYSQSCRSKNATILDFFWVADTELVYVTDRGVEHYQVGGEGDRA